MINERVKEGAFLLMVEPVLIMSRGKGKGTSPSMVTEAKRAP
jgi:hypothetical protein